MTKPGKKPKLYKIVAEVSEIPIYHRNTTTQVYDHRQQADIPPIADVQTHQSSSKPLVITASSIYR